MAEFNENLIKFGWLTKAEMEQAIADGSMDAYDVCYLKDTHEQMLISSSLEPIPIKSRVRLYGSAESAIADIQESKQTYAGEIISVRDGEKFIAYIVNQYDDGEWYIAPVYSDRMIDYNEIQNTPIKNLEGKVTSPVVLSDLSDGIYKVSGHFIIPDGTEVTSIVGNFIFIETTGLSSKKIKRINGDSVFDYEIKDDVVKTDKYATEKYIEAQGFATKKYLDAALEAFKVTVQKMIEEYVETTVELLVIHIVNEVLDARYSTEQDITDLFK